MATMRIVDVVTTVREFRVPCDGDRNSTPYVQVCKAVNAAEQELRAIKGEAATIFDDEILIRPTDDEIIVYFEVTQNAGSVPRLPALRAIENELVDLVGDPKAELSVTTLARLTTLLGKVQRAIRGVER